MIGNICSSTISAINADLLNANSSHNFHSVRVNMNIALTHCCLPVTIHSSDGVDHASALVEQRGIAHLRVEVSVVEQVVLVALVGLDALEPALDGIHRGQHGAHVVLHGRVAAQRRARANDGFLLQSVQGWLAEAGLDPVRVEDADADVLHLWTAQIVTITCARKKNNTHAQRAGKTDV